MYVRPVEAQLEYEDRQLLPRLGDYFDNQQGIKNKQLNYYNKQDKHDDKEIEQACTALEIDG
ncbi:MAG: hypothetical protein ACOC80_09465 [Petrotogales bacterium]